MNTITLTSIICFAAACLLPQQAKLQLNNNGAAIVMENGAYLVVNNLDLQNNGPFTQPAGTVRFSGNSNTAKPFRRFYKAIVLSAMGSACIPIP